MKILHCSDLHVGVSLGNKTDVNGVNLRVCDFFNTFDKVIDYAINEKIDLFMLLGDIFKSCNPTHLLQRELAKRIKRLSNAGILSFVLIGNHDRPGVIYKAHSLEIYRELQIPNVIISDVPGIYTHTIKDNKLGILSLPYFFKDSYSRYEKLIRKFEKQELDLKLVAAHCLVQGSIVGSDYAYEKADAVSLDFFKRKVNYVALGDVHKQQILCKDPPIVYSGSLERVNFGEANDEKGFVVIDFNKQKIKYTFVPLKTREYKVFRCSSEEQFNQISGDEIKEKIIRIVLMDNFDVKEDKLESAFYYDIMRSIESSIIESPVIATTFQDYLDVFRDYFQGHLDKDEVLKRVERLQKDVN